MTGLASEERLVIVLLVTLALGAGALLWWQGHAAAVRPAWEEGTTAQAGSLAEVFEADGRGSGASSGDPGGPIDPAQAASSLEGAAAGSLEAALTGPVVHVAGAVIHPGVYTLPPGSRMVDAVAAAGGVTAAADPNAVNLARPIVDGERLYVPTRDEVARQEAGAFAGGGGAGPSWDPWPSSSAAAGGGIVNLNTATPAELDGLPGIGPTLAARIVQYRTENGPFGAPEELLNVSGIGTKKLAEMRELITVR